MKRLSIEKGEITPKKYLKNHSFLIRLISLFYLLVSPILFPIIICIENWNNIKDLYKDVIIGLMHKK